MRVEINKNITVENLEIELLKVKEELSRLQESNMERDKKIKELEEKLLEKQST